MLKLLLVLYIGVSEGVIYHLEDIDYDRMPPLWALDDYHSCLRQSNGLYCMAEFHLYSDTPNELMTLIRDYSAYDLKHYNHTYIQRGICVTKTCQKYGKREEQDLEWLLGACLNDIISKEYGTQAKLSLVYYCDKQNNPDDIQTKDWVVLALICIIILLNLLGSVAQVFRNKKKQLHEDKTANVTKEFLDHFFIQRNWNNLINTETPVEKLRCLHGIRSICMFFIILGHIQWFVVFGFNDNPHDFEKGYDTVIFMLLFNGMMLVQVFFLISGFLLMYHLLEFSGVRANGWKHFPILVFLRWLRLTPLRAVSLAMSATWLRLAGSGPLWAMFVRGGVVADCSRHWWQHLLYINNYVPDDRFCELHTWYLAADFQLYVLGLVVFIATRSRYRKLVLSTLLVAGAVAPMLHVWFRNMNGLLIMTPEFHRTFRDENYHWMHVLTHNNVPSYVIGMAAGAYAYKLQDSKKTIRESWLRLVRWLSLAACIAVVYSGSVLYVEGAREWRSLNLVVAGTHRAALAAAAAAGLLATVQGTARSGLLWWRGWEVTSRLSYSAFLVHVNIILVAIAARTQLAHFDYLQLLLNYLGVVSLSFLMAVPLHILVVAPVRSMTSSSRADHQDKELKTL